jgi:hypothetical protein
MRSDQQNVKVAFTILAHSDPIMLARLLRKLEDQRFLVFVHVDAKSDIAPFMFHARNIKNVTFVQKRITVMWAGYSQVQATLEMLKYAVRETTDQCSHYVLLSGADYPLTSNSKIADFFEANIGRQFIRRFIVTESGDARQVQRLRGRHFRELANRFSWKRKPLFALEQLLRLWPRQMPDRLTIALGSQWFALTRNCVIHCLKEAEENADYRNFFKSTFAPDEMFFHTIVENSPFRLEATPSEPYVDITKIGGPFHYGNIHFLVPDVPIKSREKAAYIVKNKGEKLFTRKLSTEASLEALDEFDIEIGRSS